jgi:hypothetical protein
MTDTPVASHVPHAEVIDLTGDDDDAGAGTGAAVPPGLPAGLPSGADLLRRSPYTAVVLKPHQALCARRLLDAFLRTMRRRNGGLHGAILALGTGLGKTHVCLAVLQAVRGACHAPAPVEAWAAPMRASSVLLVVPLNVLEMWEASISVLGAAGGVAGGLPGACRVVVIHGGKRIREDVCTAVAAGGVAVVTTQETIRAQRAAFEGLAPAFGVVAVDEAHRYKYPSAASAALGALVAARRAARLPVFVMLLTATPIGNDSTRCLWSHLRLVSSRHDDVDVVRNLFASEAPDAVAARDGLRRRLFIGGGVSSGGGYGGGAADGGGGGGDGGGRGGVADGDGPHDGLPPLLPLLPLVRAETLHVDVADGALAAAHEELVDKYQTIARQLADPHQQLPADARLGLQRCMYGVMQSLVTLLYDAPGYVPAVVQFVAECVHEAAAEHAAGRAAAAYGALVVSSRVGVLEAVGRRLRACRRLPGPLGEDRGALRVEFINGAVRPSVREDIVRRAAAGGVDVVLMTEGCGTAITLSPGIRDVIVLGTTGYSPAAVEQACNRTRRLNATAACITVYTLQAAIGVPGEPLWRSAHHALEDSHRSIVGRAAEVLALAPGGVAEFTTVSRALVKRTPIPEDARILA